MHLISYYSSRNQWPRQRQRPARLHMQTKSMSGAVSQWSWVCEMGSTDAYLMRAAVQHPGVLVGNNMYRAILYIPQLDKVRFEAQDPRIAQREALRCALPVDTPLRPYPPPVLVDEE